ncbi:hypothetical protein CONPUDRAFT_71630 [Coniophora puteana RWD-64-598 SS2]|uniref:Uncharacterized protein n=1 Tax=Coniophora puteana (strain RWD-64-598) TaxID=741705 RepID=A0A5M3MWK6_CONPW|nr:uncharacterized protein CONPUDRAFT_71630 [Coniophora puteana RWD-64-598 SS2]EIW82981.1 hypothetical protein CONPUDRAFT_71630 [Coniophora puteana RWD-64-598 SS2]
MAALPQPTPIGAPLIIPPAKIALATEIALPAGAASPAETCPPAKAVPHAETSSSARATPVEPVALAEAAAVEPVVPPAVSAPTLEDVASTIAATTSPVKDVHTPAPTPVAKSNPCSKHCAKRGKVAKALASSELPADAEGANADDVDDYNGTSQASCKCKWLSKAINNGYPIAQHLRQGV